MTLCYHIRDVPTIYIYEKNCFRGLYLQHEIVLKYYFIQ